MQNNSLQCIQADFLYGLYKQPVVNFSIFEQIVPAGLQSAQQAFNIYINNLQVNLNKSLAAIYSVLQNLVGMQCFSQLARFYIRNNPSGYFSLNDYGSDFAEIVAKCIGEQIPYLYDISKLEWLIHCCLIGPDMKDLDYDKLAINLDNDNLVLHLAANAHLIASSFPIDVIWYNNCDSVQDKISTPDKAEIINLDHYNSHTYLIVWRSRNNLHLDRVTADEFKILQLFKQSMPFVQICHYVLHKELDVNMMELLPRWMQRGYIQAVSCMEATEEVKWSVQVY